MLGRTMTAWFIMSQNCFNYILSRVDMKWAFCKDPIFNDLVLEAPRQRSMILYSENTLHEHRTAVVLGDSAVKSPVLKPEML